MLRSRRLRAAGSLRRIDGDELTSVLEVSLGDGNHDDLARIGDVEQREHSIGGAEAALVVPRLAKVLIGLSFSQPSPEERNRDHPHLLWSPSRPERTTTQDPPDRDRSLSRVSVTEGSPDGARVGSAIASRPRERAAS